jgi:mannose-1-phosphate guanylyltransferase
LHEIIAYHRKKSSYVTIALAKVSDVSAFGVVSLASDGRIIEFFEKPGSGETLDGPINAGLYVFSAQFLSEIPARRRVSIEREVFPRVISSGKGAFGYLHSGYWLDVGNIDNYLRANFDLIDGRLNTQIPDIRVERKCGGLCTIGKDVSIMPGVEICGHAVIGDGCVIGEETLIEDSVFLPGAKIGSRCRIFRSVVGRRTELGDNCIVTHAALADTSRIKPFSKLG